MIVLKPVSGLCNRLRAMFSYLIYANHTNQHLIVMWNVTLECNGRFIDYFYIPNNVTIVPRYFGKIHYITNEPHPDTKNQYYYDDLRLLPHMEEKINTIKSLLGKYIAVHIRRTDHILLAKEQQLYLDDKAYIDFINTYPEYNLYIATDNLETQQYFNSLYENRIKVIPPMNNSSDLRKTTLEQAIIDLYVCAGSEKFMGASYSSFTDTILMLRNK